jgi:hypothetical protein
MTRRLAAILTLSAWTAVTAATAALAAPSPERACLAAKSRAVGAYFLCVEKAKAVAILKGSPLAAGACDQAFLAKWRKAEAKSGGLCADGVDAPALQAHLAECISGVSDILAGVHKLPACGDNAINVAGEQCDGTAFGGASCQSLGFDGGALSCTRNCRLDSSGCSDSGCIASAEGYQAPAGCECKDTWTYNGMLVCQGGCANPDGDPNGPWCFTTESCNGQSFAYCEQSPTSPTCSPAAEGYTPPAGCACQDAWSYGGKTFCGGTCANPDNDPSGPWCFTTAACAGSSWATCEP